MDCCRMNCGVFAILAAVVAGVVLGVLYAFGLVATGIIFWAYLLVGVAGLLLMPIYATRASCEGNCRCFGRYRAQLLVSALLTIVSAVVGLLTAPLAALAVVAIVLGIATFFVVLFLATVVCLVECLN